MVEQGSEQNTMSPWPMNWRLIKGFCKWKKSSEGCILSKFLCKFWFILDSLAEPISSVAISWNCSIKLLGYLQLQLLWNIYLECVKYSPVILWTSISIKWIYNHSVCGCNLLFHSKYSVKESVAILPQEDTQVIVFSLVDWLGQSIDWFTSRWYLLGLMICIYHLTPRINCNTKEACMISV
jgi:hypothetical protein